jgi:hypothetical protein
MIKKDTHEVQEIGTLEKRIVKLLKLDYQCRKIILNPGAIKHIKGKHPEDFKKYFFRIPDIIKFPDYIGKNPRIPNSIELVKRFDDFLLISIIKGTNGLLYLSSLYSIGIYTVNKRLLTGRLTKINLTK